MWKFNRQIAKKLKKKINYALPMLLFTLFILINVAFWWAGPWLEVFEYKPLDSVTERLVASIVFSLGACSLWGVSQWKKLKHFQQDQEYQDKVKNDPAQLSEDHQERYLGQVLAQIKQSINKRNFLYTLPWYLIIGVENSGKTSLINRSGQKKVFSSDTLTRSSEQIETNPFKFDWWVGEESVLIDPDGELLTQQVDAERDRRLWMHFIQWLERVRSRRPLNGLILALDVSKLATAKNSDRLQYSGLIRARMRELMEGLSTRLPVYIALTKFDLLYGFEPFFRHYSKAQRAEIMGFTFSLDSVDDLDVWLTEFLREYDDFLKRIDDVVQHAASQPIAEEERYAIYSFSRQLAGLKEVFHSFFKDALGSDQFTTAALVRGAYFTSVYQQGVPENAFDNAASRHYGLENASNLTQDAKSSSVYFVRKLFGEIIYPEAGLASDNFKLAKQKRRLIWLSVLSCSIITVLMAGSWHRYYLMNIERSDAVLQKVNFYKEQYASSQYSSSKRDILKALDQIREATLEFGFFREKARYVSDFGLYQGHTIGPKVEETYLNLLKSRFLPSLLADVVAQLSEADSDEEKLAMLRIYRMMTDKEGRSNVGVLDYFAKQWQNQFPGQKYQQESLLGHLEYAMKHTDLTGETKRGSELAGNVLEPYAGVVSQVQRDLTSYPADQRVYRNLKLSADTALGQPVNLRHLVGPVFDLVFEERQLGTKDLLVPAMLTKAGFSKYFMRQSDFVTEVALTDSWVLGQTGSAQFSEEDKKALRNEMHELYVADYTSTWRQALNAISIRRFSDINHAISILDSITGTQEPVQRLLNTLSYHTKLLPSMPDDETAQKALLKSPEYIVSSKIAEPFTRLNRLSVPVDGDLAYIDEVLLSVSELKEYLKSIQTAPDMGMAALEAARQRSKLAGSDPIYTLQRVASRLPEPLEEMFMTLANESWYVVKQEAIKYLEVRWRDDVYTTFREKLAGRYPFDPDSGKDVDLRDFEAFFAPDGVLNSFYEQQLKMLTEKTLSVTEEDSSASFIREDILDQIAQAKDIQAAFFSKKGILDMSFNVEPLRLSSNKRRGILYVDGQYLSYSHGPLQGTEFIWPNTLSPSVTSKVTLVPDHRNVSPRSVVTKGQWAFFRLLDRANIVAVGSNSVDYQFHIESGDIVYRIRSNSDVNPFTKRLLTTFTLSETLY